MILISNFFAWLSCILSIWNSTLAHKWPLFLRFEILVLEILSLCCPCRNLASNLSRSFITNFFIFWWSFIMVTIFVKWNDTIFIDCCLCLELSKALRKLIGFDLAPCALSLWYLISHSHDMHLLLSHCPFLLFRRSAYLHIRIFTNFLMLRPIYSRRFGWLEWYDWCSISCTPIISCFSLAVWP